MLVRFAVDATALICVSDSASDLATHRRVLRLWSRCGVLVRSGRESGGDGLGAIIKRLPLSLRKLWEEALTRERVAGADFKDLHDVSREADLRELSKAVDLACFSETVAGGLGLTNVISRRPHFGSPEICRFSLADESECFQSALKLADAPIREGVLVSDVWRERFATLADATRKAVVVVDRYAVKSHIERRDRASGLRRLLTELQRNPTGIVLTLFSVFPPGETLALDRLVEELKEVTQGAGVRRVDLFTTNQDAMFGRTAHNRYIRFDRAVCHLDVGIEVLGGLRVFRNCNFRLSAQVTESNEVEARLRQFSQLRTVTT